jgi:hypothetical protein
VDGSTAACQACLLGLVAQVALALLGRGGGDQVVRLHGDPLRSAAPQPLGRDYREGVRCRRTAAFAQPFGR